MTHQKYHLKGGRHNLLLHLHSLQSSKMIHPQMAQAFSFLVLAFVLILASLEESLSFSEEEASQLSFRVSLCRYLIHLDLKDPWA